MNEELQVLEDNLVDLAVEIIENLDSISILTNWVYDDFDEELKVIDYLAQLNLLKILNLPQISKIVEFTWRGNYDYEIRKGSPVSEIKNSVIGMVYRSFNIKFDSFITIVGLKNNGSFIYYAWAICYTCIIWSYQMIFRKAKIDENKFKREHKAKAGTFGYVAFYDSIRLLYVIETIGLVLILALFLSYFVLCIIKSKDMIDAYASISTLSSQTQTASVISQINSYYSILYSSGELWLSYFEAQISLAIIAICYFLHDLMILLSYFLRRISLKTLSSNFTLLLLIDAVHSGFAIYLFIKLVFYYNIDRTLSRYEEKYYAMFLEVKTSSLQPMHWFCYILTYLIFRNLYQQIYFGEFGTLVQIIIKMAAKVIKFLTVYFIIVLMFSWVGYGLFYDIEDYSTLPKSFNTMFKSSLGGFDYTLYDNSTNTSSTAGRIYLSIYLLTSTILLLNFLIAILNDTYTQYINHGKALQSREIIKLRAIYERNDYYQWLVKAPNLMNFALIFLFPFVIIFKSKRLNKVILHIEYILVLFYVQAGFVVSLVVSTPPFIWITIFIKLRNAFSHKYSIGISDTIIRLIDTAITAFASPLIWWIIYFGALVIQIGFSYNDNLIKMVEINRDEFELINHQIDESIEKKEKLDPMDAQKKFFTFKSLVSRKDKLATVFDPSDRMISESIIHVMVATMKQIKVNIQRKIGKGNIDDSIPIFVPTVIVINELSQNMYLYEHFKTIFFGIHNKSQRKYDNERLKLLAKTLANRVLWDYSHEEILSNDYDAEKLKSNIGVALVPYFLNPPWEGGFIF